MRKCASTKAVISEGGGEGSLTGRDAALCAHATTKFTAPGRIRVNQATKYILFLIKKIFQCFTLSLVSGRDHSRSMAERQKSPMKDLLQVNEEDIEIDEMTAGEVTIDTCLEILRIAKTYGMHRAKQDARTLSLQQFEEVCTSQFD
jgi:hypothetical protein